MLAELTLIACIGYTCEHSGFFSRSVLTAIYQPQEPNTILPQGNITDHVIELYIYTCHDHFEYSVRLPIKGLLDGWLEGYYSRPVFFFEKAEAYVRESSPSTKLLCARAAPAWINLPRRLLVSL